MVDLRNKEEMSVRRKRSPKSLVLDKMGIIDPLFRSRILPFRRITTIGSSCLPGL